MAEIRLPAERKFEAELQALAKDTGPRPPGWSLTPKAVETYLLGGEGISAKYVGDRALVQVAIATLASDRALMLTGEPGTAKSWLSEHLAAAISGTSALIVQGTAGTSEEQIKYGWNYAMLLAEGPSTRALVASPILRAMREDSRASNSQRTSPDVSTRHLAVSEKHIPPRLGSVSSRGVSTLSHCQHTESGVN